MTTVDKIGNQFPLLIGLIAVRRPLRRSTSSMERPFFSDLSIEEFVYDSPTVVDLPLGMGRIGDQLDAV